MANVVMDPLTAHSTSPNDAAFSKACNFYGSYFDRIDLPGNERERETFGAAMLGITALSHPESVVEGNSISISPRY